MSEENTELGFCISTEVSQGTRYVHARVSRREQGKDYPLGCSSYYGEKLTYDGLEISGFVSDILDVDGKPQFSLFRPCYRNVYSIESDKARAMARTLDKITARLSADGAREPGEVFLAMARALKMTFVCERRESPTRSGSDWRWHDVPDGKNAFVRVIREQLAAESEKRGIKAA